MKLKVATFNILNTSCRYEERKELIVSSIMKLNADLYGFQEINQIQAPQVLEYPGTKYFPCLLTEAMIKPNDPDFRIDGNYILARKDIGTVISHDTLTFASRKRMAQKLVLRVGTNDVTFVNTHLDDLSEEERVLQVRELVEWLDVEQLGKKDCVVVVGDFNTLPDSETYQLMNRHFRSTTKEFAGREPLLTFPTGLWGEGGDPDPYGCLDYIWVRGRIQVSKARVLWDVGSGNLFASDHYPIYAELLLN